MERFVPRLLILLIASFAVAGMTVQAAIIAEDLDPLGDVVLSPGVPADYPSVDIVRVWANLTDGELQMSLEVAEAFPSIGDPFANETLLYTAFVLIDLQAEGSKPLIESSDAGFLCTFHQGVDDLVCQQTASERIIKGYGVNDRNISVTIELGPEEVVEPLRVAGAITITDENGAGLLGQDFSPALIDLDAANSDANNGPNGSASTPWYKTTRGGLFILIGVGYISYLAFDRWKRNKKAEAPAAGSESSVDSFDEEAASSESKQDSESESDSEEE